MSNEITDANRLAHEAWEGLAEFWDEQMGDAGNAHHRTLIGPNVERLLEIEPGQRILDVACGTGYFLRRLIDLGAEAVGADFSAKMLAQARRRAKEAGVELDLHEVDATDEAALVALGEGQFDSVVSNMALMDMAEIEPLMRAAVRLLRPGGRFVFSVSHPVFNSGHWQWVHEGEDRDGEMIETRAVKIWDYLQPSAQPGIGIVGQPVQGFYMHRPLGLLLKPAFDAGLVIDAFEEHGSPPDTGSAAARAHSWSNYPLIPSALIVRLRLPS